MTGFLGLCKLHFNPNSLYVGRLPHSAAEPLRDDQAEDGTEISVLKAVAVALAVCTCTVFYLFGTFARSSHARKIGTHLYCCRYS